MGTLKYNNDNWLGPVEQYEPVLAQAIRNIHLAICLADDIADRQILPSKVPECLWAGMIGIGRLIDMPLAWQRLEEVIGRIFRSEITNLKFCPGEKSIDEELKDWLTRGDFVDLYFTGWCLVDETFDTKENWTWFQEVKRHCLILNDCDDILSETFEDLTQCRRNFVVLRKFGFEGYYGWRDKKKQLMGAATEIRNSMTIDRPPDKRMMKFTEGLCLTLEQKEAS